MKFLCVDGENAVGDGPNLGLIPNAVNPQCEVQQAFLPDIFSVLAVNEVCAPVADCNFAFGNCFPNLQACQDAPWEPVPGWDADGAEDPITGTNPPTPPASSSSSSCRPVGCEIKNRNVYENSGGSYVKVGMTTTVEGPGCPDLSIPDCGGGTYYARTWQKGGPFTLDDGADSNECEGSKATGFGLCAQIRCEPPTVSTNVQSGSKVVDKRRAECVGECAPCYKSEVESDEDGNPVSVLSIYCRSECGGSSSTTSSGGGSGGWGGSSVSSDQYYCVLLQSGGGAGGSSVTSGGGPGVVDCDAKDGGGTLLYPHFMPVCDGETSDCMYVTETYPNGCPKVTGCGCLLGGVCGECGSSLFGRMSVSYEFMCVTEAELGSYSVMTVVAGPYSASECNSGCGVTSSSDSSGVTSSSDSSGVTSSSGSSGVTSSSGSSGVTSSSDSSGVTSSSDSSGGGGGDGSYGGSSSSSVVVLVSSSSSSRVEGDGGGVVGSSSSVVGSSVSSGDGGTGDGGSGDGGGGGSTYVCVRSRSAGIGLPELTDIVPAYHQSSVNGSAIAATSGEMLNNTSYDSSYPVYQTMTDSGSQNWVMADYGVVGAFRKVRVGPPPCRIQGGFRVGAANGNLLPGNAGCDGSYYLGSTVQYSVDGSSWLLVGNTTSAPFLNSNATSVGTELVGDGSLKEARYIRVVGGGLHLGLSELHAVSVSSSGGLDPEYLCVTTSSFNPAVYDFVSGPYSGSALCESSCGVASSSVSSGASSSVSSGGGGTGVESSSSSLVSSSVSSVFDFSSSSSVLSSSVSSVFDFSSSSSVLSSSVSSGDCSSGFGVSLLTVLDANPDLEGYYYAEDAANGWIAATFEAVEFRYSSLGSDGLPFSVNVSVGSESVGTVVVPPGYVGQGFAVVFRGVVYCGVVDSSGVVL